ncbi:MAG: septum formation initiator family protein [Proteobacteria bacterium]|nr:septum formation initiator family protein [Pseudomonadota bacterium]
MNRSIPAKLLSLLWLASPIRLAVSLAVLALFLFLVLGDKGIYQFRQLMEMKQRLMAERSGLNEEIDRLTRQKALLADPKNLEPTIRTELGYIKPGEILFEEKPAEEAGEKATGAR